LTAELVSVLAYTYVKVAYFIISWRRFTKGLCKQTSINNFISPWRQQT